MNHLPLRLGLILALQIVAVDASRAQVTVDETPLTPRIVIDQPPQPFTEYTIVDNTGPAEPCFATLLLVTTTGSNPATPNNGWIAQALDADSWTLPMGGIAGDATWAQFTGLTYAQATGEAPADSCNAYFLGYTYDATTGLITYPSLVNGAPNDPCAPGTSLGDFSFTGAPSSEFLVEGVSDMSAPTAAGSLESFQGEAIEVPEPAAFPLVLLGLGALAFWQRRPLRSA